MLQQGDGESYGPEALWITQKLRLYCSFYYEGTRELQMLGKYTGWYWVFLYMAHKHVCVCYIVGFYTHTQTRNCEDWRILEIGFHNWWLSCIMSNLCSLIHTTSNISRLFTQHNTLFAQPAYISARPNFLFTQATRCNKRPSSFREHQQTCCCYRFWDKVLNCAFLKLLSVVIFKPCDAKRKRENSRLVRTERSFW